MHPNICEHVYTFVQTSYRHTQEDENKKNVIFKIKVKSWIVHLSCNNE